MNEQDPPDAELRHLVHRARIVALIALGMFLIADLILVALLVHLGDVRAGHAAGNTLEADVAGYIYRLFSAVCALAGLTSFWVWSIRVARRWNTHEIPIGPLLWGWLIPCANAVLPYVYLQRLWARGQHDEDRRQLQVSWLWLGCWCVFVISVAIVVGSRVVQLTSLHPTTITRAIYIEAIARSGLLLGALFAMIYVVKVSTSATRNPAGA